MVILDLPSFKNAAVSAVQFRLVATFQVGIAHKKEVTQFMTCIPE